MGVDWILLDTWIVVTAALAAIGCTLPGTFLLLRRQSLMGDALSHAVLPGIVLAYLGLEACEAHGWLSLEAAIAWRHPLLFLGAAVTAVVSGSLATWLARAGRLDPGAALGVVYTTMFAVGLLLIRVAADNAHIDQDCVLYGSLESIVIDTYAHTGIPRAVLVNGGVVLMNLVLLLLFYKELQLCTFDPGLATTLGIPVTLIEQGLLICTGATVIAAFESVGSILVIAMLVVPAACGVLLSRRLPRVLLWAVCMAVLSALLGHLAALTLPSLLRWSLAWPDLGEASTSGMMAVVAGGLFGLCWLFAPHSGVLSLWRSRRELRKRIEREDILGALYRIEELQPESAPGARVNDLQRILGGSAERLLSGLRALAQSGDLVQTHDGISLTPTGRVRAQSLVRSHRLWESYLAQHFQLESPRLHAAAEQAEHFLSDAQQAALAAELQHPSRDPHGTTIPQRPDTSSNSE